MKNELLPQLKRKSRQVVFCQGTAAAVYALAAAGLGLYALLIHAYCRPQNIFMQLSPGRIAAVLFLLPFAAAFWIFLRRWNNMAWLVRTLEKNFPEWGDRLATAVEMAQKSSAGNEFLFRVFASGLQSEVGSELGRMEWRRMSGLRHLLLPLGLLALLSGTAGAHAVLQPAFFGTAYRLIAVTAPASPSPGSQNGEKLAHLEIQVTPGSCEVSLNANLAIQAEIRGGVAQKVELYMREEGSMAWNFVPMTKNGDGRYEFTLTAVRKTMAYFVKADSVQSGTFEIHISAKLAAEAIIWEIQPPAYARTPLQRRQGWFDKLTVPEDSRVRVRFQFPRPVQPGWLLEKGQKAIALARISDTELEGLFDARESRVFSPAIQDTAGEMLGGLDPVWIQTIPDLPPYVEVLEPQMQNYVFPTEEVPFKISANDDYGLASVTLVLQYKGQTKRVEWLPPEARGQRELTLEAVLALENYPLDSRDLVFAYVEVCDNYPGEPRQIARSPLFTLMVRDYVEQYKVRLPKSDLPSLRSLFEDIIFEQTEITREVWDYLSLFETEKSFNENIPAERDLR